MPPHDALLKKICGKEETCRVARSLLRTAKAKTGPGSGHELGSHSAGLPAICAYIASQELCNNDISEVVAQTASCLKPKDFKKTLNIVRSVLNESNLLKHSPTKSPTKTPPTPNSSSPSKTPKRRRKVAFSSTTVIEDDDLAALPESPTKKKRLTVKKPRYLLSSTSIDSSPSGDALDALRKDFKGHIRTDPEPDMVVDPSPITTRSKSGPSTPSRPKHPSKEVAPSRGNGMEIDAMTSPGKRTTGESRPRRFRRAFLDQQQWFSRDPRLEREWEQAEAHKRSMMALFGHPFERYRPQSEV